MNVYLTNHILVLDVSSMVVRKNYDMSMLKVIADKKMMIIVYLRSSDVVGV